MEMIHTFIKNPEGSKYAIAPIKYPSTPFWELCNKIAAFPKRQIYHDAVSFILIQSMLSL